LERIRLCFHYLFPVFQPVPTENDKGLEKREKKMGAPEQQLDQDEFIEQAVLFGKAQQDAVLGRARRILERLRKYGFRVSLDRGALLIGDDTGRRRDVTRFVEIATVFDVLVAGLDEDPALLNSDDGATRPVQP
jgi:hypothetical protein